MTKLSVILIRKFYLANNNIIDSNNTSATAEKGYNGYYEVTAVPNNMEFEYSFAGRLDSVHSGAVESIADEITDRMIHQLLENENADETREYDKLYDYLYDYVEGAVGFRAYHGG